MDFIEFNKNWNNKLDNIFFTTIRKWTPYKDDFYHGKIGKVFGVNLNGIFYTSAILNDVRTERLNKIDDYLLICDTGSDSKDVFKEFDLNHNDKVLLLLFQRLVRRISKND